MKNNVLAHIHEVAPRVSETIEVCLSSKNVSKVNAALTSAKNKTAEALASVAQHPNKRSLSSTRKSLTAIDNLLAGLMQGLETRELQVKQFRAVCSNLKTSFIPRLENSISEEVDKFKAEAGMMVEENPELTPEQQEIRNALLADQSAEAAETDYERTERETNQEEEKRRSQLANISGDVERRLARLRSEISNVPKRLNAPYSIVRLPVAPHFETQAAINPTLLDKLAIPHTEIPLPNLGRDGAHGAARMERYVIMEQQPILLISKAYVEAILNKKTADIDDENSEQAKAWRARRKQLAKDLSEAEAGLKEAIAEFKASKTLKPEVDALRRDMNKVERELRAALQSKFSAAEKATYENSLTESKKMSSLEESIAQLDEKRKNDAIELEEFHVEMAKLRKAMREAQTLRSLYEEEIDSYYEKYAKSKDLKDLNRRLRIARKKFYKKENEELARLRLIPDAEERIATINKNSEKFEEEIKSKRKAIKRSGPAITTEDYAKSVLSVINERTHSHYALVTPTPAPNPRISSNAQDILCFWIMPTQKLSALMRHTGGKAKVIRWDFPFDSERFEKPADDRKGWIHPSDDPNNPDFLEFAKNKAHRPQGWKSRYPAPARKPRDE